MPKTLWIISLIAIVNALGYGIIIPVMYTYSRSLGLNDFQSGLLFATFSLGQFLATPIIGRMSDAYGRRPLLFFSVFGTAVSFFLMAWAPNAFVLFFARLLDGVTAGNIPVASAVISDTTDVKNRAKGFGIIGASFGFGFTFGPAISAYMLRFGMAAPFIVAGVIALIACILIALLLPETNKHKSIFVAHHLFDFRKLAAALFDPAIGKTLTVSFLTILAWSIYIYAFQPFAVQAIRLDATEISVMFTAVGIIGLISQVLIIPKVIRRFGERYVLIGTLLTSALLYVWLFTVNAYWQFLTGVLLLGLFNGFPMPIVQSLLSQETDQKSQGAIQGINTSYQSIGQILGPLIGGAIATIFLPLPFVAAAAVLGLAVIFAVGILHKHLRKQSLV